MKNGTVQNNSELATQGQWKDVFVTVMQAMPNQLTHRAASCLQKRKTVLIRGFEKLLRDIEIMALEEEILPWEGEKRVCDECGFVYTLEAAKYASLLDLNVFEAHGNRGLESRTRVVSFSCRRLGCENGSVVISKKALSIR